MKLVTWNVQCARPPLPARLGPLLRRLDAGVVVLTETSHRSLPPLEAALRAAGWDHLEATAPSGHQRGVLVAAREPLHRLALPDLPVPHRALLVALDTLGVSVLAAYAPLPGTLGPGTDAQAVFWAWLRQELARRGGEPLVVAGDLNTCLGADGAGKDLPGAGELQRVLAHGYRSAFRAVHPSAPARSWWHPKGTAFRIDDVLVPEGMAVGAASYHTRLAGQCLAWDRRGQRPGVVLSDHAALAVELA